ncbi:MAG: DUF6361 family protein [Hydrogenophaga sp.]|uniref:DUF6361 family protein n=1 Tax=Hydrogenophaga sp. TaxID=1904254 RepID=UPI0040351795
MSSSLTWLDHDAAAADRSLRLLSFFKQAESRDELGIGGVRDAISDQLFPGTSTIQTRLRYVFFIPWLFAQLDERAISAAKFPGAAREAENQLLASLVNNVALTEHGVIGREAGSTLKRMPSSVYWAGLSTWGLRTFDGTIAQYFSQADARRARLRARRSNDAGDGAEDLGNAWHVKLAKLRPHDFPGDVNLALTKAEADFLMDRWRRQCPNSLLTWLAMDMTRGTAVPMPERIWEHVRMGDFPEPLRQLVEHAQRFDALIHGAALLYNLQLAELERQAPWVDEHGAALSIWQKTLLPGLRGWNLANFWPKVLGKGHGISGSTQRFVQEWLAIASGTAGSLEGSRQARSLVERRERELKGERSRFKNQAARKQWGGAAGLIPMSYRWPVTRTFLDEWHAGWTRT